MFAFRISCLRLCLLQLIALLFLPSSLSASQTLAASVLVVANKDLADSEKVARAYLARRQIPESNLILLSASQTEVISRREFNETLHNPLLAVLRERQLIDAIAGPRDEFGRDSVTLIQTSLRYLVLCYGIPSRITGVPLEQLDDLALRQRFLQAPHDQHIPAFSEGPLAKNEASVDGELALLLRRGVPFNGFVPNPYFRNPDPGPTQDILKVTRLDGPSADTVIRMLDNALEGERIGLKGRAYVDEDGRGGGFAMGNEWLAQTANLFGKLGFDLTHDTRPQTLPIDTRIDAPVLYAGWYAGHLNAPFNLPGFRFPPGAIAVHLHSFSAGQIRSADRGWVGPLVDRGVSATVGNVAEPYLALTHHFHFLFMSLANGWNLADAAYSALPGLSWQAVVIGDPLYRPFAVSLDDQLQAVGAVESLLDDQYVWLRRVRLLTSEERWQDADALLRQALRSAPGPALALEHARILTRLERRDAAVRALSLAPHMDIGSAHNWGLFAEIAEALLQLGEARSAFAIFRKLEAIRMPAAMRHEILRRGIPAAKAANEIELASRWQAEITAPPPPPPAASPDPAPGPAQPDSAR